MNTLNNELLIALKRVMESYAVKVEYRGKEETLCYCDDYKAPDKCEFCYAADVLKKAEGLHE